MQWASNLKGWQALPLPLWGKINIKLKWMPFLGSCLFWMSSLFQTFILPKPTCWLHPSEGNLNTPWNIIRTDFSNSHPIIPQKPLARQYNSLICGKGRVKSPKLALNGIRIVCSFSCHSTYRLFGCVYTAELIQALRLNSTDWLVSTLHRVNSLYNWLLLVTTEVVQNRVEESTKN